MTNTASIKRLIKKHQPNSGVTKTVSYGAPTATKQSTTPKMISQTMRNVDVAGSIMLKPQGSSPKCSTTSLEANICSFTTECVGDVDLVKSYNSSISDELVPAPPNGLSREGFNGNTGTCLDSLLESPSSEWPSRGYEAFLRNEGAAIDEVSTREYSFMFLCLGEPTPVVAMVRARRELRGLRQLRGLPAAFVRGLGTPTPSSSSSSRFLNSCL
mmetsp:Transcript_94801/g.267989  ORF Transcript_94801/g.267989 Transcript_94801/m.267989 type:complete len:214 (-) Transcript_94801:86-727(-)